MDDEALITRFLARTLSSAGYQVDVAPSVNEAITCLSHATYRAVIVDLQLEDRFGHEIVAHIASLDDPPAIVMISGSSDMSDVIAAMRAGVADFLQKPVGSRELIARLESVLEMSESRRKHRVVETREQRRSVAPPATSANNAMRDALRLADKVAATPSSSALLVGESGVGKEVIASRIHSASTRSAGPFVRVNLAAISESVLEAELFGSVKGAFTDSKANRAGYLASADGGTILLDEIGEFRIENQAKLLRVLEERRFFPVGSDRERSINVRVIAATNREPRGMLETGLLRQDLFYRLGTVIHIPPLRERTDEIVPLAEHFLHVFCAEFGRSTCHLTPATLAMLQKYPWPGNVRQLRNAIERAVMLTEGEEIPPSAFDLGPAQGEPQNGLASIMPPRRASAPHRLHDVRERALAHVEREQIVRALASTNGSRSRAAVLLGLSRSTLYEKLKRYNVG